MRKPFVFVLTLALSLATAACAKPRHVAVVADASLAQAVFAVDDAEKHLCASAVLSAAKCAELKPTIVQLLKDVDALSAALQVTPKDAPLPKTLPQLLAGLNQVNAVLAALGNGPQVQPLADKVTAANGKLIALLTQFAGGQ